MQLSFIIFHNIILKKDSNSYVYIVSFLKSLYDASQLEWSSWQLRPILQYYWGFFSYTFINQWDIDQSLQKDIDLETVDGFIIKNKAFLDILQGLEMNDQKLNKIAENLKKNKDFQLKPEFNGIFEKGLKVSH